jgi:hypothetical protein
MCYIPSGLVHSVLAFFGSLSMKKLLLAAGAAVALMGAAGHASATDFFSSTSQTNPLVVHIVPTNEDVYMAPMTFSGVDSMGDPISYLLWCLDINHNITDGTQSPALAYNESTLTTTTSFGGNPTFSQSQINQFSYLINVVAPTYIAAHDFTSLDYIQGAMWDIGFGAGTVTTNATDMAGISHFVGLGTSTQAVTAFTPLAVNGQVPPQGFGGPGPVPEPGIWAMLIIGFGGIGAVMRRQRHRTSVAFA